MKKISYFLFSIFALIISIIHFIEEIKIMMHFMLPYINQHIETIIPLLGLTSISWLVHKNRIKEPKKK